MGAGKTEVVKSVCQQMGFDPAHSPTFGFANLYQSQSSKLSLYHVDLYRIKSHEDLESTGFWDLFSDSNSVYFIEWASRIQNDNWPWGWTQIQIDIEKNDLQERTIKLRCQ